MSGGTIVERNDYYPYGTVITQPTDTSIAYPRLTASRWRYSGKEEQQGVTGINFIDYGARLYDPAIGSWLSHDPMAEQTYPIYPRTYCAADPINFVDPEGENWYSITDSTGTKHYKYIEGQMSRDEIRRGGYKDLGYSVWDGNKYYSLFGVEYERSKGNFQEVTLISKIDKFIINYVTSTIAPLYDETQPFNQDISSSITDFSGVGNNSVLNFVYKGLTFSSLNHGTYFFPISTSSYRDQVIIGDPKLIMSIFLTSGEMAYGGLQQNNVDQLLSGYWIIGSSHSHKRSSPLQIRFDRSGAASFLKSLNNIFGTSFVIK